MLEVRLDRAEAEFAIEPERAGLDKFPDPVVRQYDEAARRLLLQLFRIMPQRANRTSGDFSLD
jgi:hypothetical protein